MGHKFTETAYNTNSEADCGFFSSNETKFINVIYKLKEKFPDDVTIVLNPEDNGGHIVAKLPKKCFKLSLTSRMLSDEQKEKMAERFKEWRNVNESKTDKMDE